MKLRVGICVTFMQNIQVPELFATGLFCLTVFTPRSFQQSAFNVLQVPCFHGGAQFVEHCQLHVWMQPHYLRRLILTNRLRRLFPNLNLE